MVVLVANGFLLNSIGAAPTPEASDGAGLSVRLEMPWTTLMAGESIQFNYILENASYEPAPVAFPSAEHGFGWPKGGQPYLEAIPRRFTPELDMRRAQWPPVDDVMGAGMEAWGALPPGTRIAWNQNRLPAGLFGVVTTEGLEAVRAHWLVGPNRWVSSDPVSVKVVKVPANERREVFKAEWSSYGYGKDTRIGTAYTALVGTNLFLFFEGYRIVEVQQNDVFEHNIDEHGTNLEITIEGADGTTRKVYYHLRHGLTRDTPWPIGPVSMFTPKPESIPPAELDALRKTSSQSGDSPTAGAIPRKSANSETSKEDRASNARNDEKEMRLWLLVGMLILLVLLISVAIWKIRRRASR